MDDPINIQFTSGTTGLPKGATLSSRNIVNNARLSAKAMGLTEKDRLCIPVPLYHCFGMVLGVLACSATGATMVFPGASFDAAETLQAVQDFRCTALHGVPAMFIAQSASELPVDLFRSGPALAGRARPVEISRVCGKHRAK